jgi:hypothetical protein
VYCNVELECGTVGDAIAGCTHCAMHHDSGVIADCSEDGTSCQMFNTPGNEVLLTTDGNLEGTSSRVECSVGAPDAELCSARATFDGGEPVRFGCAGGPGDCSTQFAGGGSLACPLLEPCRSYTSPGVSMAGAPATKLTILKLAVDHQDNPIDGTFEFRGPPLPEDDDVSITLTTQNGGGTGTFALAEFEFRGDTFEEVVPAGWDAVVSCDIPGLVVEDASGQQVVRFPIDYSGGNVTCVWTNVRRPPAGVVRPTGTTGNEMVTNVGSFGLPPGNRIAIAGTNGFEIRDAITDIIPTAGTDLLQFLGGGFSNRIGALVVKNPLGDGSDGLFFFGPFSYARRQFFPDIGGFGFTQVAPNSPLRDAVHVGGDPSAPAILVVGPSGLGAFAWQTQGDELWFTPSSSTLATQLSHPGTANQFISAFAYDLSFDTANVTLEASTGWVAVVTDGTPGKLWVSDPHLPFTAVSPVGDLGDSPRRIRCLPSHGLCAVSNFGSDSLSIVQWDGLSTAAIVGTQAVGDGPVGIDLRPDGANVKVVSTGFNDDTYTVTTLGPTGSVLASDTAPAPEGCNDPGHAIWLAGTPGTIVLSCNGAPAAYALITP